MGRLKDDQAAVHKLVAIKALLSVSHRERAGSLLASEEWREERVEWGEARVSRGRQSPRDLDPSFQWLQGKGQGGAVSRRAGSALLICICASEVVCSLPGEAPCLPLCCFAAPLLT